MSDISRRILTIQILKINLKVRFPCNISFAIKIDGKQNDVYGEQQLKNGEARLNFSYFHEIEVVNDKIVNEPKISILIFLVTSSGRIPAGSLDVKVSKAKVTPTKQTTIINKCPDKNAFLQYQLKLAPTNNSYRTIPSSTSRQLLYSTQYYQKKYQPNIRPNILHTNRSTQQHRYQKSPSPSYTFKKELSISTIKQTKQRQQNIDFRIFDTYGYRDLSEIESSKKSTIQRQLEGSKSKIFILESDLNHKDNLLKETQQETKQLQKQNQKMENQLKTFNYKIESLEKHCKQLTSQIKDMTQKHQEEKMIYENGVKRIQIRQNSYKEQIKTLTDKFYNCQNQKQRMVHEKNLCSKQYQSRQKKLRQSHQQKQKKHFQVIFTLEKKVDNMQKEIQKMNQQLQSSKSKFNQILQKNHQFEIQSENLLAQKQKIKIEHNNLKYQLTKLKNQKQILESNLQSNNKSNEERRLLKKQLNSKEIENSHLKDRLQSIQLDLNKNKDNHFQHANILKQKDEELKMIQHNFHGVIKEIERTNEELDNKENKIISLIEELQFQIKQNKTYQIKIHELEQQIEDLADQYNNHEKGLYDTTKKIQQQLQEKNQRLEQNAKNIQYLQKQCQQYERCLNQKGKHLQQCELQISKLNEVYREVQFQKLQQQHVINQMEFAQKMKENEYQKVISDLKKQLNEFYTQNQQVIKEHHQEKSKLLKRESDAKSHLNEKIKMIQKLQNENKNFLSEKERLKRQIEKKDSEIEDKLQQISQLTAKLQDISQQRQAALKNKYSQSLIYQSLQSYNYPVINRDNKLFQDQQVQSRYSSMKEQLKENQQQISNMQLQFKEAEALMAKYQRYMEILIKLLEVDIVFNPKQVQQDQFLEQMQRQLKNKQTKALCQHFNEKNQLQIALRTQMERVNQLQVVNTNLMNELKEERENVKKVMRELQHECHLLQKLKIQYEQEENKIKMKDLEIRKEKMKSQELKNIIQLVFILVGNQKKDESYIQELRFMIRKSASSQTQPIKQQLIQCQKKIEYFLLLQNGEFESKGDLQIKIEDLQKDMTLLKQQLQQKRSQIKVYVNEFNKYEKDMKAQQRIKRQLYQYLQNLQKNTEELLNTINNLQKEKKVSIFILVPMKQSIKKINGYISNASKNVNKLIAQKVLLNSQIFTKNKQDVHIRPSIMASQNVKFS